MKNKAFYVFYFVLAISLSTCKVPYTPVPITAATNYLVVEGLINITDSTYINLSRTVNVMSSSTVNPELKAVVSIESSSGSRYQLIELGKGVYAAAPLNLSVANQYRLRIKTANGNSYTSDFVQAKVTPPIDTLAWTAKSDGLYITVNAHDPQNNTRYYRWDYTETWEFYSYITSFYLYNGVTVVPRTAAQQIHHCWGNFISANVLLASTSTLSQDIITHQPITFVVATSEKLSQKYSIIVSQYALTKDAYDYWTLLKTNTEQLGSIFDAQPSASIGNLHNVNNAAEPVIGFVSAGTVSKTRIFVDRFTQLPAQYYQDYFFASPFNQYTCVEAPVMPNEFAAEYNLKNPLLTPVGPGSGALPLCVDCTLRGTTTQPSFWK